MEVEEVGAGVEEGVLGQLVVGWRPAGACFSVPPLQNTEIYTLGYLECCSKVLGEIKYFYLAKIHYIDQK